jgi:hypothetical protein
MRLLLVLLLCASSTMAEPRHWYTDKANLAVIGLSLASSLVASHEVHDCRQRAGIEHCDGGYGPFKAREVVRFGFAGSMAALSIAAHRHRLPEWAIFAAAPIGWNAYIARKNALVTSPCRGTTLKCD